eukprot:CAMPEP_0172358092 /NCGR_PEP_ID=MMETSP1060-20121228/2404_1 /TAXON_ID=37318 /ORGANISM="Pseudo-nitzschia pungens, Strain cf. cingulata" /LENGTH=240 /DNA_ID=CAMNT_0013079103 /DNA_START=12 /DNA_END=732 /DNA_ORIENTATION=+
MAKQTRSQAAAEAEAAVAAATAAAGVPVAGAITGTKAVPGVAPPALGEAPPVAGVGAGALGVVPPVAAGVRAPAPAAAARTGTVATGAVHPVGASPVAAAAVAGAPAAFAAAAPATIGISRIQQGPNINIQPRTETILLAVAEEMRAINNEAAAGTASPAVGTILHVTVDPAGTFPTAADAPVALAAAAEHLLLLLMPMLPEPPQNNMNSTPIVAIVNILPRTETMRDEIADSPTAPAQA